MPRNLTSNGNARSREDVVRMWGADLVLRIIYSLNSSEVPGFPLAVVLMWVPHSGN